MSKRYVKTAIGLSSTSAILLQAAAVAGAPGYTIYPFGQESNSVGFGQGISSNGSYAAGIAIGENSAGLETSANGILYNVSAGTSTVESQTGVVYPSDGVTVENYGAPYSVNNNGIMFGSSGAGSVIETGAPTYWVNGSAYNLKMPFGIGAGQVYGSNDLNSANVCYAVGSVGGDGGLNSAAIFTYNASSAASASPTRGYVLSSYSSGDRTTNGGVLQTAFAINNHGIIVGTADDPNNAALTVPFILNYSSGTTTAQIIPNSTGANSAIPFAISNSGLVTGSESFNGAGGIPFIYNMSSGATTAIPLPAGLGEGGGRGINDIGEVVGTASGQYAVPFLYDGTNSYDLQTLVVNNQSGSWNLDDNTSSGAYGIADNGDIVGRAMYNGVLTSFLMIPTGTTKAVPQYLTFNNAGGTGDGLTWDTVQQNFNNGLAVTAFSSANGDYVSFTDANNGHYNVSIPATVTPGSTTFNNSNGNYVVSGAGGIGGSGVFYKYGTGSLTLNTSNTYTGPTNIAGGTVILGVNGALPVNTQLQIEGSGTTVIVKSLGTAYAVRLQSIGVDTGAALDLTNNDLILHGESLENVSGLVADGYNGGAWDGTGTATGITSSLVGGSHPLMALGVIVNDNQQGTGTPLYGTGGAIASTFGGEVPVDGDILVKYTYYGDANLDGKVDGSDYSLLDNAYQNNQANPKTPLTGWYNGDFNYDGVINGSDYTLMDNAFNNQGVDIAETIAGSTALVAGPGSAVPEPAMAGVTAILAGIAMLGCRRKMLGMIREG